MFKLCNLIQFSVVIVLLHAGYSLAQVMPESGATEKIDNVPIPSNIEPNGNPLTFPTNPQEVNIGEVTPITLEQAIEIGLRNNKDLEVARLELQQAEAELREAQSALFPTIDLSSEVEYSESAATKISNERFPLNPQEVDTTQGLGRIELSYDIYNGGNRGATIRQQKIGVNSNQLNVEIVREQARFDITDQYYKLQGADAVVAIRQAAVEDANQSLRDAQLREQAGVGTRFDALQAEVDLANASQQLTRAIADQRKARRELAQTLSIDENAELLAADEIQQVGEWTLTLDESIVLAYKNRAELERFLLNIESAKTDRQIALSEVLPTLSFFTNYNFLDDDLGDNISVKDGYAVGGRVRWRLFDGGRAFARASRADRQVEISETQFAKQRNEIRYQVEQAYYDLIANKDNISTAQTAVVTAAERLRLARLRFQAGVGTQTDVINAQRDLTEARGNLLQAMIGYNQSINSLQRAISNFPDNQLFKIR